KAGRGRERPRLDERVGGEAGAVLHGRRGAQICGTGDIVPAQARDEGRKDGPHLPHLVGVVRREGEPGHGRSYLLSARAAACSRASSALPAAASASRASSSARENGAPSAVPCTSTKPPSPVMTTFMSVSARTSST